MTELTGLDSNLEKSHFKTERKHKYSFGKSQRFTPLKSSYTIDFFDKPISRDTRTCSFGYGSKYFFVPPPNNPSASAYELPRQRGTGISFGLGRDVFLSQKQRVQVGDYLSKKNISKSPPSNTYNPTIRSTSKFKKNPSFSLGAKQTLDSFIQPDANPQPTKYDVSLEKNGRTTLSNFKTSKKPVFAKSARFIQSLQKSLVGPGHYEVKEEMSSRKKSLKNNVFALAAKTTFAEEAIKTSKTPGPIYYIP